MSRGVNKVILVGNAGSDCEIRYSGSGTAIANVSVATTDRWKDRDGNQQERTEWHRVKFFGKLAEISGEYIKKGQQVYIEGSLRTDKYKDKDGIERFSTDIIADQMQLLGGARERDDGAGPARRGGSEGNRGGGGGGRGPGAPASSRDQYTGRGQGSRDDSNDDFHDDQDIPFATNRSSW